MHGSQVSFVINEINNKNPLIKINCVLFLFFRDINYSSAVHDLKLLLLRFAQEKSFHDDTGGGGPQSNMYIIPYLLHMALYVINT